MLVWLSFGYSSASFSQQLVQGSVRDQEGNPLPGASLSLKDGRTAWHSDARGEFKITLNQDRYELRASYVGYEPASQIITVQPGMEFIDFVLEQRQFATDEVVITATRAGRSTPVSQVTRNRQEIERVYTGQDGGFLLEELSPSIVAYSESGTNFGNYAGIRLRGIDQTRINMTLNGVPLNDVIDQGVFFSNFTDFGNSIESVQIQRGVGTSANGTSSYAGSINFESISLLEAAPRAELQFTGGSFNTRRLSAEVATGKMENDASFYARYTHTLSDGFRRNTSTDSRSVFLSGALFKKRHTFKFTGFSGLSANGLAYAPVAISDIERDPRTNYISENDVDNFGQWMAQGQHIFAINRDWSLVNTAYYSGAGGDFPFGFEDDGVFTQINYPLFNDHYGLMSTINGSALDGNLRMHGGVHANVFLRRNIEQIVPDYANPYYEDRSRKNELSGFYKMAYQLGDLDFFADVQLRAVQLELEPDVDFLGFDPAIPQREWVFVNPKVGFTYTLNPELQVYASFGRSGREPTRFDILGSTQINAFNFMAVADLSQVSAEFVNDWEGGIRYNSGDVQLQANAFYMQFENEIAPIGEFIDEGFVQIYRNQESSYRLGAELDYEVRLLPSLRLRGNATWMRARISTYFSESLGVELDNVSPILTPEWNVQTTLEYRIFDGFNLALRTRYLSEAFMTLENDPEFVVPESLVADLRFEYRFYNEHSISVMFNNVLDNQYYTFGAPVELADGSFEPGYYVQPPRHIYATLHLRF